MKLLSFSVENFRGYTNKGVLNVGDFTGLFGKNDAGKSTIFEAMDIFFNETNAQKKINEKDWNVNLTDSAVEIVMIATLTNLPETLVLENVLANLRDEALTDQDGNMQIIKRFSRKTGKITTTTSILALYPEGKENLYELTQSKLRTLLRELGLDSSSEKRNTTMRSEILQEWKSNGTQIEQELSIATKGLTKSIWEALKQQLPDFQLFKSDRDNSDTDPEVQNPMTVLIKSVLDNTEIHDLLVDVQERVISELENSTKDVLDILNQLNPEIGVELSPSFGDVNWAKAFKLTLTTELGIPLENRGSGIRRLVLLSYFQNEARKKRQNNGNKFKETIYAVEEPETALHPHHQKMLIMALKEMSEQEEIQILLTTHSPEMAKFVSVEHANLIKRDNNKSILVNGEQAVEQIAEDLGILTDISTIKDKKIVVLEGKWDQIAIEQQIIPAILNLDELKMWQEKVILLPAGGTNIDNWQKAHTLDQFKIPYYIIVDGDDAGTKYVKNGLSNEFKLNRPTMEFYLPYTYMDMILNKVYFPGKLGIQEYCNEPDLTIEEEGWNAGTNGFIFGEKGIELFYNRIYHFPKVEGKKSIKSSKFKEHTWLNIPKNTITMKSLQVLRCNESTAYDEWRGIVETILKDTIVSEKSK